MPRLYQLPDGNWVDLDRIIALQAVQVTPTQSYLKIIFRHSDEGFVRYNNPDFTQVCKVRDEVANAVGTAVQPLADPLRLVRNKIKQLEDAEANP